MQEVTRSIEVPAGPERVWTALTEPAELSRWLGADVELDVRPGGDGTATAPDGGVRRIAVEDVDPGRALTFHWWPADQDGRTPAEAGASTVAIRIHAVPEGTRVTVTETARMQARAMARV
jgi:uncharacterized protein YndB with AHSA1/START domain